MAKEISSFNAKTHLSSLLSDVENGQEYIITRHNSAIAKLVPIDSESTNITLECVIDEIKDSRKSYKLKETVRKLIEEGRR